MLRQSPLKNNHHLDIQKNCDDTLILFGVHVGEVWSNLELYAYAPGGQCLKEFKMLKFFSTM